VKLHGFQFPFIIIGVPELLPESAVQSLHHPMEFGSARRKHIYSLFLSLLRYFDLPFLERFSESIPSSEVLDDPSPCGGYNCEAFSPEKVEQFLLTQKGRAYADFWPSLDTL
jgi:hypothetical protein